MVCVSSHTCITNTIILNFPFHQIFITGENAIEKNTDEVISLFLYFLQNYFCKESFYFFISRTLRNQKSANAHFVVIRYDLQFEYIIKFSGSETFNNP